MQALFVGIHMAHLGSTSLFGLYLAMGGVLAVSQGQCMLGRGVVTDTPPSHHLLAASCSFWLETLDGGRVTEQIITGN